MTEHGFRYRLYGLSIDSEYALPGVPPEASRCELCDLTIRWCDSLPEGTEPSRTVCHPEAPGLPSIRLSADGSHILTWDETITFLLGPDGKTLRVMCRDGFSRYVPTVTVGVALGLVLHLRACVALHASVLQIGDRTIAVLGRSGSGKSSFAAAMVLEGARLYSDDIAAIIRHEDGRHYVQRGCMGLRLCPDAVSALLGANDLPEVPYANKLLWDLSGQPALQEQALLGGIYILQSGDYGDVPTIAPPLTPAQSLPAIIDNYYPPQLRRLLDRPKLQQMAGLAQTTPLHVVRYRKTWEQLRELAKMMCR
ncbi:MAG: hypothetical protein ABI240_05935 [Sphingomonas sp.]